ncbi:hypothetical protein TNCV_2864491 [Trichonephila clavipes]|nr:hypothetical protein TNCV_2864491 [Trichonephila clavipes]
MAGFPLKSEVRLLVNSTTLKYKKDLVKKLGKKSELGSDKWLLRQDNASAHMTVSVKQFPTSKKNNVMGNPPYSPDL